MYPASGTVNWYSRYGKLKVFLKNKQTKKPIKETRIYNGEKTTSLTSGAGKTGQPLVKE